MLRHEKQGSLTNFTNANWALALEQMLIFVLVFSKWIAPKGEMTNQEMSQLLLVTIAAGADILELLETFGESNVCLYTISKKDFDKMLIFSLLFGERC